MACDIIINYEETETFPFYYAVYPRLNNGLTSLDIPPSALTPRHNVTFTAAANLVCIRVATSVGMGWRVLTSRHLILVEVTTPLQCV